MANKYEYINAGYMHFWIVFSGVLKRVYSYVDLNCTSFSTRMSSRPWQENNTVIRRDYSCVVLRSPVSVACRRVAQINDQNVLQLLLHNVKCPRHSAAATCVNEDPLSAWDVYRLKDTK